MKQDPLFNILNKLIQLEFGVSKQKALELMGKTADYNIQNSADVLNLIKSWGYKTKFEVIKW